MRRKLRFVQVCPDDDYFIWQTHLWLESLRNLDKSNSAVSLVFNPFGRPRNMKWEMLIREYPEAEFHFYEGTQRINGMMGIYLPVLRPYTLATHFTEFPDLVNDAIFYCDADVLFTKNFNVDHLLDDNISYLSNTRSYISSDYFFSKRNDVKEGLYDQFMDRDVLREAAQIVGITKETCIENKEDSGGAQYLLKNVTAAFWFKVMADCVTIRRYLMHINYQFFESESKGFQSWCSDMWAVLWNLWFFNQETKVVSEMDFAWATDPIEKLDNCPILHNAGVVDTVMDGVPMFYKGKYHAGGDPTKDKHIYDVIDHPESRKKCSWYYADFLLKTKEKYKLNY